MADILFVDDEQAILSSLQRAFRGFEGYTYHFAASPKEALQIISEHSITVLVSDHKMPQMLGSEFLARVKEKRPDTIRMLLTGQADLEAVEHAVNSGEIYRFFLKPWKDEELRQAVKQAAEYHKLRLDNKQLLEQTQQQNEQLATLNGQLEDQVRTRTEQLADALYTARALNEQLIEGLYKSMMASSNMIKLARPELGSHSRRVADHCVAVAQILNMKGEDIKELEVAALLHDGGKLSLPTFLIEKHVSDYRREELDLYKLHPAIGTEHLKHVKQYESICNFILMHHERYDGSGFPSGLHGRQIPLQALVIGIMDEFDHLMHRKQHNREYNSQYACQQLAEYSDKEYPQRVVQAVLDYASKISDRAAHDNELRVGLADLTPNVTLARDVYSMSGALLLAGGATLNVHNISRMRAIAKLDPIVGEIYINKVSRRATPAGV